MINYYGTENYVKDKVIIITGASSGFGRATSIKAAAMGGKVVLAARREELLKEIVDQIRADGGDAVYIKTDVRCRDQVEAMAQYAIDTYGRIDVLINDAGIMPVAYYSDYSYAMEHWEECLDTALKGTLYATCAVYDQMIKQGRGHVINISSILGNLAVNGSAIYNVSKAGVRLMAESLRTEASGKIKTTVIRPSSVPTTGLADTVLNIYASLDGMYGKAFEAMAAPHPEAGNRDSIHFKAPDANDLADNIIYAINQPWGVSISDITVRSSGECMFV